MSPISHKPVYAESEVFRDMTLRLLTQKRVNGFFIQGRARPPTEKERAAMDVAFLMKTARKGGGRNMPWADWLVESLFPTLLYEEHGESLAALIKDKRIHDIEGFQGLDNWNNSFGRMARPRPPQVPEGFMHFLLERWRGKYRGMPHYYFDVEYPEWVTEPLVGRPDIPKTGRTSVSCVMNYGFHWLNGEANISVVLRHLNWSHGWGDVYGGERLLRAICKELGGLPLGNVNIFANSASMDEPQAAKRYLEEIA